jgi:DNA-binding GntR family transcriptional regulator
LNRLATEGLVRRVPNRGYVAASPLDLRAIAGIYDFRLMLEPGLARRAARRADATGGARLISLCDADALEGLLAPRWNDNSIAAQDITFHSTIAQMAGNDLATEALAMAFGRGITFSLGYSHAAMRTAWEEHRLIAEAIAARDADTAADAMRTHLRTALQRFEEAIAVERQQHAAT